MVDFTLCCLHFAASSPQVFLGHYRSKIFLGHHLTQPIAIVHLFTGCCQGRATPQGTLRAGLVLRRPTPESAALQVSFRAARPTEMPGKRRSSPPMMLMMLDPLASIVIQGRREAVLRQRSKCCCSAALCSKYCRATYAFRDWARCRPTQARVVQARVCVCVHTLIGSSLGFPCLKQYSANPQNAARLPGLRLALPPAL